jgi:hypothetical protein
MNKLNLIFGIVVLVPSIAIPQNTLKVKKQKAVQVEQTLPVICDSTEVIMSALQDRFKEIPVIAGKSTARQSYTSVWGNPETKSFTIVTTRGDVTCVLDVGTNLEVILPSGTEV